MLAADLLKYSTQGSDTTVLMQAVAVEKWLEQSLRPHATARPATAPRLQDTSAELQSTSRSQKGSAHHYEVASSPRQLLLKELHDIEQVREGVASLSSSACHFWMGPSSGPPQSGRGGGGGLQMYQYWIGQTALISTLYAKAI